MYQIASIDRTDGNMDIGANLQYWMKKRDLKDADLAEKLQEMGIKISKESISKYRRSERTPNPQTISAIAKALNISEQDLFDPSKKIDILKDILKKPSKEALDLLKAQYPVISETIEVPLLNHQVSAGTGLEVFDTEVVDTLIIDKEKLLPGIPPDRIEGLQVKGNSMEPYVKDGDYVIIYRFNYMEPIEKIDDVYVINYDNQLMVKQIQFVGGSKIRIVSINPSYPPIDLDMDDSQVPFGIIGRVILRILKG